MKPFDIYNLWGLFDKATKDHSFTLDARYSVGLDMMNDLPPEMLCSASKPTLTVVREAMESRLTEIDNERRKQGSTSPAGLCTGASSLAGPGGDDHSADAGGGVLVAGVERGKKPARKAKDV